MKKLQIEHQWQTTLLDYPEGAKNPNKTKCARCGIDKKDYDESQESCVLAALLSDDFFRHSVGYGTICGFMHKIENELFDNTHNDYDDFECNEVVDVGPFRVKVKASNNEFTASIGFTDETLSKMNLPEGSKVEMYRIETPMNIDPSVYLSLVKSSVYQSED